MQTVSAFLVAMVSLCPSQGDPRTENATAAVLKAFKTHDIVMLGEIHSNNRNMSGWTRSSLTMSSLMR